MPQHMALLPSAWLPHICQSRSLLAPSHIQAGAFGVARAQLVRDPFCDASLVKCFSAVATSINTNIVHGLPSQLPLDAGLAIAKVFWRYPFGQTDFVLYAELSVDNAIKYNSDIIHHRRAPSHRLSGHQWARKHRLLRLGAPSGPDCAERRLQGLLNLLSDPACRESGQLNYSLPA